MPQEIDTGNGITTDHYTLQRAIEVNLITAIYVRAELRGDKEDLWEKLEDLLTHVLKMSSPFPDKVDLLVAKCRMRAFQRHAEKEIENQSNN